MEWVVLNWWWLSAFAIPLGIGGLKLAAKKTDWVWDDKVTTLLGGWWNLSRGHMLKKK